MTMTGLNKSRVLEHLDKFTPDQQTYLHDLTEAQAKCITSYWDDPIHFPHIPGKNTYDRTFKFLGLERNDPIVQTLFGGDLK